MNRSARTARLGDEVVKRGHFGSAVALHGTRAQRVDGFGLAVPDAGLDVCMLLHDTCPTQSIDRFQLMLRAFCAMSCNVTRAAMMEDRIELQINGATVVLGEVDSLCAPNARFYRPDMALASRQNARLGYLLAHHDLALRLRIDTSAPDALIDDICRLSMKLHQPKAVIVNPQGLVLSSHEFLARPAASLQRLDRGADLAPSTARYARPEGATTTPRTSPFARSGKRPAAPARSHFLSRRLHDKTRADQAPRPVGEDTLDQMVTQYCLDKSSASLEAAFRDTAPVDSATHSGPDTSGARANMSWFGTAERPRHHPALICDAVMLEHKGHTRSVMAPLLVATMIHFTQFAAPQITQPTGITATGSIGDHVAPAPSLRSAYSA